MTAMQNLDTEARKLPKQARGRTAIQDTPITTRSRIRLDEVARRSIEERLRRALAPFGTRIRRASIRFEDLNGPRGGVDLNCAIKVVFDGTDSVIVEQQAENVLDAVRRVIPRVTRSVRRQADRNGKAPRASVRPRAAARGRSARAAAAATPTQKPARRGAAQGSLVGRRVGRAKPNLAAALERPEKQRRDAYIDTAEPGVTESDRRAGGSFSARRNSKQNESGMTYALEDSRAKPSRKSTRGSGNGVKAATQLTRRAQRKVRSPKARAARAAD